MTAVSIHCDPDHEYGVTVHTDKPIHLADNCATAWDILQIAEDRRFEIDHATARRVEQAGTLAYWANTDQISRANLRHFADTLGFPVTDI